MNKFLLFLIPVLFFPSISLGQNLTSGTLDNQFSELIETSNTFKGYKVVDEEKLYVLQNNVSAHIRQLNTEIENFQASMASQEQKVTNLEKKLKVEESEVAQLKAEKDAITFLGIPINKTFYKMVMWGIVGLLALVLAYFVVLFKRSHVHTREARKNLKEIEQEFETFRAKSLEKEQRMGRLLQDERNKLMKIAK